MPKNGQHAEAEPARKLSKVEVLALGAAMRQVQEAQAQLNEVFEAIGLDNTKQYKMSPDGGLVEVAK